MLCHQVGCGQLPSGCLSAILWHWVRLTHPIHDHLLPTPMYFSLPQISSGQWKHAFQVSDHLGNTHLLQLVVELHLNITDSDGEYGAYLVARPSFGQGGVHLKLWPPPPSFFLFIPPWQL